MKPYFSKLLTEQERAGSRNLSRKWGGRVRVHPDPEHEYEDEITFVSSARRRQYGYNHKEFTDVLSPLRGFLEKNVGRPWNDVHSELCKGLDRRSVTGQHVFTHLWQYVERYTVLVDGEVKVLNHWSGNYVDPNHNDFYIHPQTGILCTNPEMGWSYRAYQKRRPADKDVDRIEIWVSDDGMSGADYQRLNGLWFEVEWSLRDVYAGYYERAKLHGMNPWRIKEKRYPVKQRQLGKKELKHLGLHNIPLGRS